MAVDQSSALLFLSEAGSADFIADFIFNRFQTQVKVSSKSNRAGLEIWAPMSTLNLLHFSWVLSGPAHLYYSQKDYWVIPILPAASQRSLLPSLQVA